jgi:hypothetical protein
MSEGASAPIRGELTAAPGEDGAQSNVYTTRLRLGWCDQFLGRAFNVWLSKIKDLAELTRTE